MEFDADLPIHSTREDKYNRSNFAKLTAKSLLTLGTDKSFVLGLYGEWGYGKTSVLNLVKEELKNKATIIDLEPWAYCDGKTLAASLLYEIKKQLHPDNIFVEVCNMYERHKGVLHEVVENAGDVISVPYGLTGKIISNLNKTARILSSQRAYRKYKFKIEREIRKSGKPVIVFIDDLDRLEGKGILDAFKLIRSVANIHGVHYVLAFDQKIVVDNITNTLRPLSDVAREIQQVPPNTENTQKVSQNSAPPKEIGQQYLEKIIQMPLDLPLIDQDDLSQNLFKGIIDILASCNAVVEESEMREIGTFCREVEQHTTTPRIVTRCLNNLRFIIPALKDETNISDLIRFELIHLLRSDLYQTIKDHRSLFVNENSSYFTGKDVDKRKTELEKLLPNPDDRWLVSRVFSSIDRYFYNATFMGIDEREARRRKRIFSPDYIDRYFAYGVTKGDVPDHDIIDLLHSEKPNVARMTEILQTSPLKTMRKIRDHVDAISDSYAICLILVLISEHLPSSGSFLSFWEDPVEQALYTATEIMLHYQYDSDQALKVYQDILAKSKEVKTISCMAHIVGQYFDGKNAPKKSLLDADDYTKFKSAIVQAIQRKADQDLLPISNGSSLTNNVYSYWFQFGDSIEAPNHYVKSRIKTATAAVDFISQFLVKAQSMLTGEVSYEDLFGDDTDVYDIWFCSRFDAKYLYDLLISSDEYKKYKNISLNDCQFFRDSGGDDSQINLPGHEHTPEFRSIIAQQFIYSFEKHNKTDATACAH